MTKITSIIALMVSITLSNGCGTKGSGGHQSNEVPETESVITNTPEDTAAAFSNSAKLVTAVTDLPKCDSTTQGLLYYVVTLKQFQVCQANTWTTIDLTGAKGDAGTSGASTTGASPEKLNCYRQSDNQLLGTSVSDCFTILLSDGIKASFDLIGKPQAYFSGAIYITQGHSPSIPIGATTYIMSCGYTTANCSSDCYVSLIKPYHDSYANLGVTYDMRLGIQKNVAIYSVGNWYRTTGTETDTGQVALGSYIDTNGVCVAQGWTAPAAIKVTTPWNPPTPLNLPLGYIYLKKD